MIQNFRSAFHGFNRDDVVHYLEYINNKHTTELNQLHAENDLLSKQLEAVNRQPEEEAASADLEALQERCAALEAQLAEANAAREALAQRCAELENSPAVSSAPNLELEAYRRAERTERRAQERAQQIYRHTNEVLTAAVAQVDSAAEQVNEQMLRLQNAVNESKQALRSASASISDLRSAEED